MVSDTNSFAAELRRHTQNPIPLLALRLPEFARIAWRDGKRKARKLEREAALAFEAIAARVLRAGDAIAHDRGSDVFVIALTSPSRQLTASRPSDYRAVLQRAALALTQACGLHAEMGWTLVNAAAPVRIHREIELALERGARELERYEFFSAVGHELRTPLTSIRGYLETLLDGGVQSAWAMRFLEIAHAEALRMARLLDGMFEFSLLDLAPASSERRRCNPAAQVRAACEALRPLAARRGIRIRWYARSPADAAIDADAFSHMLGNLLENAIKYGRAGGCVRVRCRQRGYEIELTVDDDGEGIAPAERDAIFGLRVRGSHSRERPGTGIGLAIVKTIVERAGGSITAGTAPSGGARFTALLPAKAESAGAS